MKEELLFCQEYFEKRSDSKYGNHRTSPSLQKPYITAGYELLITDCIWKKKASVVLRLARFVRAGIEGRVGWGA